MSIVCILFVRFHLEEPISTQLFIQNSSLDLRFVLYDKVWIIFSCQATYICKQIKPSVSCMPFKLQLCLWSQYKVKARVQKGKPWMFSTFFFLLTLIIHDLSLSGLKLKSLFVFTNGRHHDEKQRESCSSNNINLLYLYATYI